MSEEHQDSRRTYTDHGLTGTTRDRPGLDQALAACREAVKDGRGQVHHG